MESQNKFVTIGTLDKYVGVIIMSSKKVKSIETEEDITLIKENLTGGMYGVACIMFDDECDDDEVSYSVIDTDAAEKLGISHDEIMRAAKKRMSERYPVELKTMTESCGEDPDDDVDKDIFLLSSSKESVGASALMYDGVLEYISSYVGGNYYVAPFSSGFVVIIRDNEFADVDIDTVRMFFAELESESEDDEELDVITKNIFYYNADLKSLNIYYDPVKSNVIYFKRTGSTM